MLPGAAYWLYPKAQQVSSNVVHEYIYITIHVHVLPAQACYFVPEAPRVPSNVSLLSVWLLSIPTCCTRVHAFIQVRKQAHPKIAIFLPNKCVISFFPRIDCRSMDISISMLGGYVDSVALSRLYGNSTCLCEWSRTVICTCMPCVMLVRKATHTTWHPPCTEVW
jgi:hypothetical protein